jgi:hypothetical protein
MQHERFPLDRRGVRPCWIACRHRIQPLGHLQDHGPPPDFGPVVVGLVLLALSEAIAVVLGVIGFVVVAI